MLNRFSGLIKQKSKTSSEESPRCWQELENSYIMISKKKKFLDNVRSNNMRTNLSDDKKMPSTLARIKFKIRNNQFIYRYILNHKFRVSKHILIKNDKLDKIVSELFECGISVRKIEDVIGQVRGLDILEKSLTWVKSNERYLEQDKIKKFLWTYFPTESSRKLDLFNPITVFYLSPDILYVAGKYLGYIPQLNELVIQKTTIAGSKDAIQSQKWHRDPQEMRTFKVFLYLSDVNEDSGPFIYIKGSSPTSKGKLSKLFPQIKPKGSYPDASVIEKLLSQEDLFTATASSGTVIFCDTAGIHKGGFAKSGERIMATGFFPSFKYTAGRKFKLEDSTVEINSHLDPLAKKVLLG